MNGWILFWDKLAIGSGKAVEMIWEGLVQQVGGHLIVEVGRFGLIERR